MMDRNELLELLRKQPFAPFMVRMSNGEAYEVKHPEFAMLTPLTLYIFDAESEKVVRCSLFQVASVEYVETSDAGSSS